MSSPMPHAATSPGSRRALMDSQNGSAISNAAPGAAAASASVSDHGAKSVANMALVFAVSATVVSLVLMLFCYGLWNRYDLLKINYNDLKAAMLLHGINPHPHFPAESP